MATVPANSVCSPRPLLTTCAVSSNSNARAFIFSRTSSVPFSGLSTLWSPSASLKGGRSNQHWRFCRPNLAAQKAAQTEGTENEEAEVLEEETTEPTNGVPVTSILEGLRKAIAADDEDSIAKLEAHQRAIAEERDALAKQVATLLEEAQTGKERLLRLNADFENFRKRAATEKANLSSSVRVDVIEALLPMVDNFERAKASIVTETEGEQKIDKSYQGIYKQFVETMKGLGVVAVETVGKQFDPNLHEAIMKEESTEYEDGIIIQEFRRGFSVRDKLVRPAMVKVSSGPGPAVVPEVVVGAVEEETEEPEVDVE